MRELSVDGRRQPKLALVVHQFPERSETFIVNKFLGLLDAGYDAHVVCTKLRRNEWRNHPQLQDRTDLQSRVHVGWTMNRGVAAAPRHVLAALFRSPRAAASLLTGARTTGWRTALRPLLCDAPLLKLRPDLVHCEFGTLALHQRVLKQLLGFKLVVSFRGYDLNFVGLSDPGYYDGVWRNADAVHVLGEDLWQRACRRGCPPDIPHAKIAPAIDADFFDAGPRLHAPNAGSQERPLRVLSVGRLAWIKGYEYALSAVRQAAERGVHCEYRIIGDGQDRESLYFARHQLGLGDAVEFLGALPPEEIRRHMRWADVFLLASVSEGFCNAVLEAQSMQLPVVCSDAGGLGENVVNDVTGFVVPRRDAAAFAEGLQRLAADAGLRERMGRAGRQRVVSSFRTVDQIAAFDRLYRQVLSCTERRGMVDAPTRPATRLGTNTNTRMANVGRST